MRSAAHQSIVVTSAPAVEPVTLEEQKEYSLIKHNQQDRILTLLIKAARRHLEQVASLALITQTRRWSLRKFPASDRPLLLPYPPLQAVTSVTYIDAGDDSQTWDSAKYQVDSDSRPPQVLPVPDETYPAVHPDRLAAVQIMYVCGFGDAASAVPEDLRLAVMLHVNHAYENREPILVGATPRRIEMSWWALVQQHVSDWLGRQVYV